jgi:hypothetical protein
MAAGISMRIAAKSNPNSITCRRKITHGMYFLHRWAKIKGNTSRLHGASAIINQLFIAAAVVFFSRA